MTTQNNVVNRSGIKPRVCFSLWRWSIMLALVSNEVMVTGESILDLKATSASLGWTGEFVCPLAQVLCT